MSIINEVMGLATKAERQLGGDYIATIETRIGSITCIASQVPKLHKMHWRFNFRLNDKVISKEKLQLLLN